MRAMWKGSLSFGLVNIPVQVYTAVAEKGLDLHLLHKEDMSRIRFARVCQLDGHEIAWKDIVRGYEVRKGEYVILDEEDFKKANVRKTQTIEISAFCEEGEVASAFFEHPYYLEPDKGADKSYALLREALKKTRRVGLASVVFRNREHLCVVKTDDQVLVLNTLRYVSEINPPELRLPEKAGKGREIDMAVQLIEQLSAPFQPEQYHDTYTEELKELIAKKAQGKTPRAKGREAVPTKVPDLMAALRASLERASQEHRPSA